MVLPRPISSDTQQFKFSSSRVQSLGVGEKEQSPSVGVEKVQHAAVHWLSPIEANQLERLQRMSTGAHTARDHYIIVFDVTALGLKVRHT